MGNSAPQKIVPSIQVLRGVAATLIVMVHVAIIENSIYGRDCWILQTDIWGIGNTGVDIFFVISGFIMTLITGANFSSNDEVYDFLVKRIIRIVPLYWFFTSLKLIICFSFPAAFANYKFSIHNTIASFLFIPSYDYNNTIHPVVAAGWTLNFEIYFYIVFTVFAFFCTRYFLVGITLFFLSSTIFGAISDSTDAIFITITDSLVIEFVIGCCIGKIYRSGLRFDDTTFLAGVLVSIMLLALFYGDRGSNLPRVISLGVPSAILVAAFALFDRQTVFSGSAAMRLGDASYSLYLSHGFTLVAVKFLWKALPVPGVFGQISLALVGITTAIVIGFISYTAIEKPLLSFFSRNYARSKERAESAGVT